MPTDNGSFLTRNPKSSFSSPKSKVFKIEHVGIATVRKPFLTGLNSVVAGVYVKLDGDDHDDDKKMKK